MTLLGFIFQLVETLCNIKKRVWVFSVVPFTKGPVTMLGIFVFKSIFLVLTFVRFVACWILFVSYSLIIFHNSSWRCEVLPQIFHWY